MPLSRESLYEEVWAEPMLIVAKRYEVSSNYLARVCKLLRVPRPPAGYWSKKAVGREPPRPQLTNALPSEEQEWNRQVGFRGPYALEVPGIRKARLEESHRRWREDAIARAREWRGNRSARQLLAIMKAWEDDQNLDTFCRAMSRSAQALNPCERATMEEKIAKVRQIIGGDDPFQLLKSWSHPDAMPDPTDCCLEAMDAGFCCEDCFRCARCCEGKC